jgi:hypothetical protein
MTAYNKKYESIPMELDNKEKIIVKNACTYTIHLIQNSSAAAALKHIYLNGVTKSKIERTLDAYILENSLKNGHCFNLRQQFRHQLT